MYDLIIRNAYLRKKDDVCDIGIFQGRIEEISKRINKKANKEIDAKGNFVSPPFVDTHTHMDKSFTSMGERFPKYNEFPYIIGIPVSREKNIKIGLDYYMEATHKEIERHVLKHAYTQILNGTLYTRTHVDVDRVAKTKGIKATISARKKIRDLIDIQIVAFAQSGLLRDYESQNYIKKSLELGADLIGDLDPATVENNIEESLNLIFKIAREYNVDIDIHIMDPNILGIYTLERLAKKTIKNNYQGRVTCSHAWCLGDASIEWLENVLPLFKQANLKFITCYTSTPYKFPVKKILDKNIPLACATDNVRDFWSIMGSGDLVQGLLIETQRLNMTSNKDMDILWDMVTVEGAKIMNIEKNYGIKVGKKADFVIFDSLSPQWTIITQARKLYVIKDGKIIVKDGEMLPEFRERFNIT